MGQSSISTEMDQINTAKKLLTLENQAKNGVNWFYWIAALSIINSIVFNFGGGLTFVMGLGLAQIVDGVVFGLTQSLSGGMVTILRGMGIFVNLLLAGMFVVFGIFAKKGIRWVLVTGMVIYAIDAALVGIFGDWLGLLFHGLALVGLWTGWQAMRKLRDIQTAQSIGDVAAMQTILAQQVMADSNDQQKRKRNFRRFTLIIIGIFGLLTLFVMVMVALYAR